MKIQSQDRRSFFAWCVTVLGAMGLGGFLYSVLRFMGTGPISTRAMGSSMGAFHPDLTRSNDSGAGLSAVKGPDGMYEISTDSLPKGGAAIIAVGGPPVTVVHALGMFRVFDATCTHLGCLVKWDPKQNMFVCPCHGGKYNADGKAVAGPPPYALKEHKVTEKDGKIKFAIS